MNTKYLQHIESVIESAGIIALGYLFFIVIFSVALFLFGQRITELTLPLSFFIYGILLLCLPVFDKQNIVNTLKYIASLLLFVSCSYLLFFLSVHYFAGTYDTSWDGQGYHANGVISLANGWNPLYERDLPVDFPDASIFVKGYPKAVWIMQSTIYVTTGLFNAAKGINAYIIFLAFIFIYTFLRKININAIAAGLVSIALVLQPPFIIQIFSFSEDLFSYEMTLIAIASLGLFTLSNNFHKYFTSFIIAELFLIGTKFSNLPVAMILGSLALYIAIVIKMDKDDIYINKALGVILTVSISVFITIPYLTNIIHYGHIFYPSNLKEINKTYKEDNIPKNLAGSNTIELMFYSLFSQSQTKSMGKDDPQNIARLKIPFFFTVKEFLQSASIFNNRVGAAGPLFSGGIILSFIVWLSMFVSPLQGNNLKKIPFLIVSGIIGICLLLTALNPVPNLLRYNMQIILIPFIILIAALILYKQLIYMRVFAYLAILILCMNSLLFSTAVLYLRTNEAIAINNQLRMMENTTGTYTVSARNFYSNYIRLAENDIPFTIVDKLPCAPSEILLFSHYTTHYCKTSGEIARPSSFVNNEIL